MNEHNRLADQFEAHRTHLRSVAYRLLGSVSEAEDAVQEAWLRLARTDASTIDNLRGWLTTVVARICLNMLQARKTRREGSLEARPVDAAGWAVAGSDPADEALLADSVGLALLVVLDTLAPAERLAFVLHDVFAVPFDEIAPIVARSPTATRQLASGARRRVRGGAVPETDLSHRRTIVQAFLNVARDGDFGALLALLDPDVVLRADAAAVRTGALSGVRGVPGVAEQFVGRARFAQPALVNGSAGAVWAPGGTPRVVFDFTIARGKIVAISILADPDRLRVLNLTILHN